MPAYIVIQRTGEFGIRLALGAGCATAVTSVLGDGLKATLAGCVRGLGAAAVVTPLLASELYGVRPLDPATYVAVMLAVSVAAYWIPARRASKVDPMVALRYE